MSSVVISGDTSGAITLSAPAVSGTNTATLPAATGTVMVSGNMPAFSAYKASAQAITSNVYAKVLFQTEVFDTNNNFSNSTFTPTVAGYYQINACCYFYSNTLNTRASTQIYKNGSAYAYGQYLTGLTTSDFMLTASSIVYLNGTTDYVEIYGVVTTSGSGGIDTGSTVTYFNGSLVRAA